MTRDFRDWDRYIVYSAATVRGPANQVRLGAWDVMVEVKELAEKMLDFFHEEAETRGRLNVPIATLYKAFEKQVPYDVVQRAIGFLVDRDLIAPFSYSLTAKGRRERGLRQKT